MYRFIIIEDMLFNRRGLEAHLRVVAPAAEIIAVDVRPTTKLEEQIPVDLHGWTIFLDHKLGDGWMRGADLAPLLKARGAHVLCLSDETCFVEDQSEWFDEKFQLASGSTGAAERFALFLAPVLAAAA